MNLWASQPVSMFYKVKNKNKLKKNNNNLENV